jgi:hypothetical protein
MRTKNIMGYLVKKKKAGAQGVELRKETLVRLCSPSSLLSPHHILLFSFLCAYLSVWLQILFSTQPTSGMLKAP